MHPEKCVSVSCEKTKNRRLLSTYMEANVSVLLMNASELRKGFYFLPAISIPTRQYCTDTTKAIFGPFHHSNSLPAHPYFIQPQL